MLLGFLVFQNFDCKFAKSKKFTAAFNTSEKAIQEGYKPCGTCKISTGIRNL